MDLIKHYTHTVRVTEFEESRNKWKQEDSTQFTDENFSFSGARSILVTSPLLPLSSLYHPENRFAQRCYSASVVSEAQRISQLRYCKSPYSAAVRLFYWHFHQNRSFFLCNFLGNDYNFVSYFLTII